MYVCECECLLWLALSFLHHRNSPVVHLGLTVADWVQVLLDCRCHLKIAFTPTPPPWNTRTDKKRLFSLGIQKPPPHIDLNMCAQPNFSVYLFLFFFALPSVKWSIHGRTHTPRKKIPQIVFAIASRQFLSKEEKMLRTIGLENPLTPQSSTFLHAILSSPCSMLIKSGHSFYLSVGSAALSKPMPWMPWIRHLLNLHRCCLGFENIKRRTKLPTKSWKVT